MQAYSLRVNKKRRAIWNEISAKKVNCFHGQLPGHFENSNYCKNYLLQPVVIVLGLTFIQVSKVTEMQ